MTPDSRPAGGGHKPRVEYEAPLREGPLAGPCRTVFSRAGTLAQTSFPALLYKIFAKQLTGVLAVGTQQRHRLIYFREGEPCWVKARSSEDSLGAILVDGGFVTVDDVHHALESMSPDQFLGHVLVTSGKIQAAQLMEALGQQVYRRLLGCFGFADGLYEFRDGDEWVGRTKAFPQNPIQIIADGVGGRMAPNVVAAALSANVGKYVVRTEKWEHFFPYYPSPSLGRSFLDLVDGERTVGELVAEAPERPLDVLRTVWSLHLSDMVAFSAEPRLEAARPPQKGPAPPPTPCRRVNVARRPSPSRPSRSRRAASPLERKLSELYVRVGVLEPDDLLGVPRGSSAVEVRRAYDAVRSELPDAEIDRLRGELKTKAREVVRALDHAKELMLSMAPLESPDGAESSGDIWHVRRQRGASAAGASALEFKESAEMEAVQASAAILVRKARSQIDAGKWQAAYRSVTQALAKDPVNPAIEALKVWVVFHLPTDDAPGRHRMCLAQMKALTEANGALVEAFYYLGKLHESVRDIDAAYAAYERALSLEPRYRPAHRGHARLKDHPLRSRGQRPWWKVLLGME